MSLGVDNPSRFHFSRKILVGIILVVVMVLGVLVSVYYFMSVASVTSLTIDEIFADRNFVSGTFPNRNTTYTVVLQVWSDAHALSVTIENPVFVVNMDGVQFENRTLAGGTLLPGSCITYYLRYNINESKAPSVISYSGNNISVKMVASTLSWFYSRTITTINSASWNWTTATLIYNSPFGLTYKPPC